jgi:hypothetical protein
MRLTNADGTLRSDLLAGPSLDEIEQGRFNLSAIICAGVYLLIDAEARVLYIGETICFAVRIAQHKNEGKILFSRVEAIISSNASERVALEARLIEKYKPRYNKWLNNHERGTARNTNDQFRKPGYESTFDKHDIVDPEFDTFNTGDLLK